MGTDIVDVNNDGGFVDVVALICFLKQRAEKGYVDGYEYYNYFNSKIWLLHQYVRNVLQVNRVSRLGTSDILVKLSYHGIIKLIELGTTCCRFYNDLAFARYCYYQWLAT